VLPAGAANANIFAYNKLNQLTQATYFDGRQVNYSYTLTGQRYQVTDSSRGSTPVTYGYDQRDRVTSITQPGNNSVSYQYDPAGNRTVMTATVGSNQSVTSYGYDYANRLQTVSNPSHFTGSASYSYDPIGLRNQLSLPNGVTVNYHYDELNRLTNITDTNSSGNIASYAYQLDPAGNRTSVTELGGSSVEWSYDDTYRLTNETRKNSGGTVLTTTNFTYDATGNRLKQTINSQITNYSYNELDQLKTSLSGSTTTGYSYDQRGNLVQAGSSSFGFDAADRMVTATVPGGSASYLYDADGRRVRQTANSVTTNYLWDELSAYGDVVAETDGSNNLTISYVLANCDCSTGAELLSQKKNGIVSYFLMDGHSGVRTLTNSSGSISESYNYDAFGNLLNGPSTPTTNYLYTGQQFDVLTGLYDLRARYYNAPIARFLSRDVAKLDITNPAKLDRYVYTNNNPINFNDPSGLDYDQTLRPASTFTLRNNSLKVLGFATLGLIVSVVALATLLPEAKRLYTLTRNAIIAAIRAGEQGVRDIQSYTIVVAEPILTNGVVQKLITISDFYTDSWDKTFEIIRRVVSLEGYLIPGSGSIGSPASHAERLMVDSLVLMSGMLREKQEIPGAVSHSRGICTQCQIGSDVIDKGAKPAFVKYRIDGKRDITLALYATALQK
jgi:RHS repeat-associated protein